MLTLFLLVITCVFELYVVCRDTLSDAMVLHDLKMNTLHQLDLQQPGQEGWVLATDAGRAKLVNRFGFSAQNRAQNTPK